MNIYKIKMDVKESLSKSHDVNIDNVFLSKFDVSIICVNIVLHRSVDQLEDSLNQMIGALSGSGVSALAVTLNQYLNVINKAMNTYTGKLKSSGSRCGRADSVLDSHTTGPGFKIRLVRYFLLSFRLLTTMTASS